MLDVVGTTELNGAVTINSNLTVDTDTLFVDGANDRVGIGTDSPGAALDVRGDVMLGASGELSAVGGVDNLRMIAGAVTSGGSVFSGTGFTVLKVVTGVYEITYLTNFSGFPVPVVTPFGSQPRFATIGNNFDDGFSVRIWDSSGSLVDSHFKFIVVGPR